MLRYIRTAFTVTVLSGCQLAAAYDQRPTFTPGDRHYGDYVGTIQIDNASHPARAMVVPEKHQDQPFQYRVRIIDAGGERKTLVELNGQPEADHVPLTGERDGSWAGEITEGVLTARREGNRPAVFRGTFTRPKSPTEGLPPPPGATVLLPYQPGIQTSLDAWQNKQWRILDDGSIEVAHGGNVSQSEFGAVRMHLEFALPYKCYDFGQGRGNSGVYLLGRYEVQVLDTYGFDTAPGHCGGIYANAAASVEHVCFPPTCWQTYDITFYPAGFGESGQRVRPARITVQHNGITIHEDLEIEKAPTPASIAPDEAPRGPLHLQDHGNPVRYRNIWYVPIEDPQP